MKSSEWSDRELEELLRQMPKIQDNRDPREIYQNLSLKKRRTLTWMIPAIVAAAALLLFFISVPKLIDGIPFSTNHAEEQKISADKKMEISSTSNQGMDVVLKKQDHTPKEKTLTSETTPKLLTADSSITAAYPEQVGNGKVLTYWIPDQQAQILIPVSTIIPDPGDKSWLDLYNEKMAKLKEVEWGLSEYYPMNASLSEDKTDNSVIVDVPVNHTYGQGSASEINFLNAIQKDVSTNSHITKVKFKTNGQKGIELGNFGRLTDMNIELPKNHSYFFYYSDGSETPFLVPSSEPYKTINEALLSMENDSLEGNLKASLTPALHVEKAEIKEETLYVTINNQSKLINDKPTLYAFEAVLLTAKEFGIQKVKLENSPISSLGPFDLTKEINVPIAPNLRRVSK